MTAQPLNSEPVQGPVEGRGVAEIRGLCDAATPGPWRVEIEGGVDFGGEGWFHVEVSFDGATDERGDHPGLMLGDHDDAEADAEFIAAARELVPSLLAEVEAAHRFEQSAATEREALLVDVERLREDLAYAIADAKRWHDGWQELGRIYTADVDALRVERDSLRGVVQAVRELHQRRFAGMTGEACGHCSCPWPCPTIRALAAAADAPQPAEPPKDPHQIEHEKYGTWPCVWARTPSMECPILAALASGPADPPTKETQR